MPLLAPNPRLATETVTIDMYRSVDTGLRTIDIRTLADDSSGGQAFEDGSMVTFPAIATQQVLNRDGIKNRAGSTLSEALWDVLLFSTNDPGVLPQKTTMLLAVQNRTLIATTLSTQREAGAWYVLCKSID